MRHRIKDVRLGRDTNHRKALIANLLRALILEGEITTTKSKARVLKSEIDGLIKRAQTDTIANRRLVHRVFGKRDVVNTLFERIAPLFENQESGFTTSEKVGVRRGDSSEIIKVALLKKPEITGTLKKPVEKVAKVEKKATKPAVKKAAPKAKAEPAQKAAKPAKAAKSASKAEKK